MNNNIIERVIVSEEEIEVLTSRIASEINRDFAGEEVVLVAILNGAFMFASDLMKQIELDCYIDENKNGIFDNGEGYVQTFKLIPPKGFEPGHQYEVNIKVYGPRNISLQWGAIEWKEGDDIDVGEERW